MSKLTPKQIFNGYRNKDIDKSSAINYLRLIVENSDNNKLRVESLEILGVIKPESLGNFEFLEHLLVSDVSGSIRSAAARIIINSYLDKAEKTLIWVFENETSVECLSSILRLLDSIKQDKSEALKRLMEEIVGKKYLELYDISSRDAFALEMVARRVNDNDFNRGNEYFISFKLENKSVVSLTLREIHHFDYDILGFFLNLRELCLLDCLTGDLTGLRNLNVLKVHRHEYHSLNRITEIKGLDTLISLERLDLSHNSITKINGLNSLIKLRELDLSWNPLKEIKNLKSLTKLEALRLRNTGICEIKGLKTLVNLKKLDISLDCNYNKGIDEIIGLDTLSNLEYLNLAFNHIEEIKGLENLGNLEALDLRGNQIREIKGLGHLKNLHSLRLANNLIPDEVIDQYLANNNQLKLS
ncbi:MAG: leucine-rich repeat domain-containing protein [Promethearchaeota archaeon]